MLTSANQSKKLIPSSSAGKSDSALVTSPSLAQIKERTSKKDPEDVFEMKEVIGKGYEIHEILYFNFILKQRK
jgi:hypothetical protein